MIAECMAGMTIGGYDFFCRFPFDSDALGMYPARPNGSAPINRAGFSA
jgi:hypothetical protein